jgi:hypothetical protein
MGARKLVGRVRRLVGRAFFYDRTFISDRKTWSRIWYTSEIGSIQGCLSEPDSRPGLVSRREESGFLRCKEGERDACR